METFGPPLWEKSDPHIKQIQNTEDYFSPKHQGNVLAIV